MPQQSSTQNVMQARRMVVLEFLRQAGSVTARQIGRHVWEQAEALGSPQLAAGDTHDFLRRLLKEGVVARDIRNDREHFWRLPEHAPYFVPEGRPEMEIKGMSAGDKATLMRDLVLAVIQRLGAASYNEVWRELRAGGDNIADILTWSRVNVTITKCYRAGLLERIEISGTNIKWQLSDPEGLWQI